MSKIEAIPIASFHQVSFNPNNVSGSCSARYACTIPTTFVHPNVSGIDFDTAAGSLKNAISRLIE